MKKILKSDWTKVIFTTLLGFISSVAYDIYKQQALFQTIKDLWNNILKLFSFEIKVWVLIILVIIYIFTKQMFKFFSKRDNAIPNKYLNYRSDVLKKWKWSWSWRINPYNNELQIVDLRAKCPKCNATMIFHGNYLYGNTYECSKCDFKTSEEEGEVKYKIEQLIFDKINEK